MKARIDPEACIACGLCTDIAAAVFRFAGDTVVATDDEVAPEDEEAVQEAVVSCPVEAITVHE